MWVVLLGVTSVGRAQNVDSLHTFQFPKYLRVSSEVGNIYPFIDFSKNNFQFFTETSDNFRHLYHQIDSLKHFKDRQLHFYHIGGSHVQADIYTNVVRMFLQTQFDAGSGERGWTFPLSIASTNNPSNYRYTTPNNFRAARVVTNRDQSIEFGTMGAVIMCPDTVVNIIYHHKRTDSKPGISRLRIFHNKGEFPYELNFATDEILIDKVKHNAQIGYTEISFSDKIDSLDIQFKRDPLLAYEMAIYGFQLLNDDPGISYNTIGINGAGLYSYLDCKNFEEQLKTYPPDFFAFAVGTNDANVPYEKFNPEVYKNNLEKLMQIALRANPKCALLLTVPNDAYYKKKVPNRNVARQREVIIELATKYKMAVWDFYGIMGELGSSKTWNRSSLMQSDLVHFTSTGYHLKGDLFIDGILKFMAQFQKLYGTIED